MFRPPHGRHQRGFFSNWITFPTAGGSGTAATGQVSVVDAADGASPVKRVDGVDGASPAKRVDGVDGAGPAKQLDGVDGANPAKRVGGVGGVDGFAPARRTESVGGAGRMFGMTVETSMGRKWTKWDTVAATSVRSVAWSRRAVVLFSLFLSFSFVPFPAFSIFSFSGGHRG